jgi:MFS family permease
MTEPADAQEPIQRWILGRYLAGALPARIADEGARVSLVLLALQERSSAALGGAMIAALLIPHVVAAPLVGVLVDRARRPGWVLASAVLLFAGSLLSTALLLGHAPLWLVFVLLLLGGCCGPAITGGLTSQLPALVGERATPRAFGFDSMFYNIASMAGPALAGLTAAAVSAVAAQCLLAASAAFAAAAVTALPIRARPQLCQRNRPGLLSGAREILHRPTLRVVTLSSTLGQLGPGALPVVAAVLATSLHRPANSGLLLTAVAAGSFIGSLLCIWYPIAPDRSPIVATASMIGIGTPIALAAAAPSIHATVLLFGLSGIFIGPFGAALFTARTHYCAGAVRTQVFTIGAGSKVTASAIGAALVGLLAGIPIWAQLLLVASSPLLAGILGTLVLKVRTDTNQDDGSPSTRHEASASQH